MTTVLAPRVDTLMTVSRFSADELRRHHGLTRDIVVGHEGWEHVAAAAPADEHALLQRLGLRSGAYLLAVGSNKASKNFGLIGRALALLGDSQRLPVVVAGACDPRLYPDTADTGAAPALHWLGFVPDDELNVLYRHAAWFIFPSLYEGFGLPPLEAMANGCAVLAARTAASNEIYGDAVLYFDPHDAASLADLLREVCGEAGATRRQALIEPAQACLALHRWGANAEVLLERLIAAGAVAADDHSAPRASPLRPAIPTPRP